MSEKAHLPLPSSTPTRSSLKGRFNSLLALVTLLAAPSLISRAPAALDIVSETARRLLGQDEWSRHEYAGISCPAQPEPIFPKMIWNMTMDEKRKSADLYSQAVVRIFRY